MSKLVVDVYVKIPQGIILNAIPAPPGMAFDCADRLALDSGLNEGVDRGIVERWLARNKDTEAVKRGDIRILPFEKMARDSKRK